VSLGGRKTHVGIVATFFRFLTMKFSDDSMADCTGCVKKVDRFPMVFLRHAVTCAAIVAVGCARIPILGKLVDSDTLPERTSRVEIVITGKLLSVNERALIEEEIRRDGPYYKKHYTYYDLGKISVLEVLKGSYGKKEIFIKFLSFDQTQPPQEKIDCKHFSVYDIWNPGIWLIDIDTGKEPLYLVRRGNYLPSSRREDVKKCIEEDKGK
jgi:hypothetical protein